MIKYTKGLAAKFKPMETVPVLTPAPTPSHNAWKCTPKFKFNQVNFPNLGSPSCTHMAKKQCCTPDNDDTTLQQSEPSQHMAGTAITDNHTKLIQQMQDSFSQKLNLIKKDHQDQQKKFEACLRATEAAIENSQKQLLREFKNMNTNYASAQQSYANLHNDFEDRCYFNMHNSMSQMMKILINMNQSLSNQHH